MSKDIPDFATLKARQRGQRDDWPQDFALRIHRAISWIGRAWRSSLRKRPRAQGGLPCDRPAGHRRPKVRDPRVALTILTLRFLRSCRPAGVTPRAIRPISLREIASATS